MEKTKKEGENAFKNRLMSADENVRSWHLRGKSFKENIMRHVGNRLDENRKSAAKKSEKHHQVERTERSKSPKKDLLYLHLKPFLKSKTARDNPETRDEVKRYRKPSDRLMKRKESLTNIWPQEKLVPKGGLLQFNNAWEHTNYSIVPTVDVCRAKNCKGRERKRKKSQKVRKRNKSDHRMETKNSKNMALVLGAVEKNSKIKVIHPSFDDFVKDRKNYMNESGGKAVVIYHRHNRRKYLHPHTGDGYQFEQIAFAGSCEATVDMVQSRRSLSEPRQNSTKELCVTRRRTRFQVEPHKIASTQADFHSAIDFFKQNNGTVEFKKFEEINSSLSTLLYQNPMNKKCIEEKKYVTGLNPNQMVLTKSLSSTNTNTVMGIRLQQTAEKKLDLHKEMIRAEKNNKKKFWESIQRSLNYRCALAEMFSSQSYVSSNESSKFFSSNENSTNRSTNIYVRESVISSYQGFSRFIASNKPDPRNLSKPLQLKPPPNSTYRSVKTVLDTILIKEDEEEEEEILLREHIDDGFTSQSSSNSTMQTENTPYDTNRSCLHYASDKLSLIESTLGNSDTNSKLELLMARLSEEIRKCSQYMKKLNETAKKKVLNCSSASDSKINLRKKAEDRAMEKRNQVGWGMDDKIVYPVFVYSASDMLLDHSKMSQRRYRHDKGQELVMAMTDSGKTSKKNITKSDVKSVQKMTESITSQQSFVPPDAESVSKSQLKNSPSTPKTKGSRFDGFQCCDDCKLLKKRIVRLEQDLEKIEKRMPLYPSEYQETIKDCLESLNVTSETFLKRLKSCAKLRYLDQNKKCKKGKQQASKRSASAPGPVVHEYYAKPLYLRPSSSDCQLNVGMKLTMENVDPVTRRKLCPEIKDNLKQEGNVQCRLIQSGKKPVLMMDTDFSYNPETGMLFKKKKSSRGPHCSPSEYIIPLDNMRRSRPSAGELKSSCRKPSHILQRAEIDSPYIPPQLDLFKPPQKFHRDPSPEMKVCLEEDPEIEILKKSSSRKSKSREHSRKSLSKSEESVENISDLCKSRPESKERRFNSKVLFFANKKHEKTGRISSQIPIRRKPTPNSTPECVSLKSSSATFTILPMGLESRPLPSATSLKKPEKSNKVEQIAKSCSSVLEVFPFMEKSTQTYQKQETLLEELKAKIKTVNVGVQGRSPIRHYGVQVGVKRCNEEVQVECATSTAELECGSPGVAPAKPGSKMQSVYMVRTPKTTTTMNVAVQANTTKRRKSTTSSVGLQISLPTEENLKYINDLQIQKKVNMAIAELCFHLSQDKEQEGA